MFVLPNGAVVDVESIFDAMEDTGDETAYFLDTITGEVGTVDIVDQKEKMATIETNARYIEIPGLLPEIQIDWLEEFINEALFEEEELAEELKTTLNQTSAETALDACEDVLTRAKGGWLDAWDDWYEDRLLDEMERWFQSLPVKIEEKPCGQCEDCKHTQESSEEE